MNTEWIKDPAEHPGPTGPRTQEGKDRCRFNAVRHGLTGRNLVLTEEESEMNSEHSRRMHAHYLPVAPNEEALVCQIADCIWRLDRATSIGHGIFALCLDSQEPKNDLQVAVAPAKMWPEESKELTLLALYAKRIDNKLAAHKAALKALQQERNRAAREAASPRPLAASESVCSAIPIKPAAVPIKPKIDVPGPDLLRQRDAA